MLLRGTLAAAALFGCAFVSVSFFTGSPKPLDLAPAGMVEPTLSQAPMSLGNPAAAASLTTHPSKMTGAVILASATAEAVPTEPFRYNRPVRAKSGDTLIAMLRTAGVEQRDAAAAIDALKNVFDPRRIRPGNEVNIIFERVAPDDDPGAFMGFTMSPYFDRDVEVARATDGGFQANEIQKKLIHKPTRASGEINNSLFVDGGKAGIPVQVLLDVIRTYSWDVDFQRDIWPGDGFEVMWEHIYDETGELVNNGEVLYAKLTLSGTPHALYRYETSEGDLDYFDEKGQSARKALMRTPIDGARLSSGYGRRKHPVLGYTKKHTGVDFAAPIGTPIYAAGDGRVEKAQRWSSYGNYIRIRHNSEYSTAYAHISKFARGIKAGVRVKQGQIVAYVGNTGRTTGPHLHYEILRKGAHVNPLKVRMPSGEKLKGKELARFQAQRAEMDTLFAKLSDPTELAETAD